MDFSDIIELQVLQHPLSNIKDEEMIGSLSPSPPLQNSDNATSKIDPFAFQAKEDKRKQSSVKTAKKCANCGTFITTEWRRRRKGAGDGGILCNACYCYEKSKGSARPKSMRKDIIQKRNRKPKYSQSPKSTRKALKKSPKKSLKKLPEAPVDQHQPNYSSPLDTLDEFLNYNYEINRSLELLIPDIENELGTSNVTIDQRQYASNEPLPPFQSIQMKTNHQSVSYITAEFQY